MLLIFLFLLLTKNVKVTALSTTKDTTASIETKKVELSISYCPNFTVPEPGREDVIK